MTARYLKPLPLLLLLALTVACGNPTADEPEARIPQPAPAPRFTEVAAEVGLTFRHENGGTGEFYFVEMFGSGGALFDYDNDGDLDVFLVQGTVFNPPEDGGPPTLGRRDDLRDRLYRNDLAVTADGSRQLAFTDVTEEAKIAGFGYGMGVATGDYNGDGWVDLYVTAFGSNQLWRNRGDGTFEDVTQPAGVDDTRLSTSAAFVDYDGDGQLDLYVANYVDYYLGDGKECIYQNGLQDYCGPQAYTGQSDRLFRNRGDGTFEDASGPAGILGERGTGLGVVTADFNGDALMDIYVANDLMPNLLWINQGDGTLLNDALLAGTAVNMDGLVEASMGVDAGDFDNDGDEDLFMTHLSGETNTLYLNDGTGIFEDQTLATGLGAVSLPYTGFGTAMLDFDNDGWLDLAAVNGAVHILESQVQAEQPYHFEQPNQLFRNLGDGRFEEVTAEAGPAFELSEVSRGSAVGDVDNDGDPDLLIVNNQGPVHLLLNQTGNRSHWLGVELLDAEGRLQTGARVEVLLSDGRTLKRRARADASYCSANDPRVLIGLGAAEVERLRVHWPGGEVEEFEPPSTNTYTALHHGTGRRIQ